MGSQIRSIVLTDVHLGASNSILTQVAPGRTMADTHHPSPALLSLADCLRTLVAGCNGSGRPATLIAAGGHGEEFAGRLRGLIETDAAPWSTFTASAAELVVERRRQIATTLEDELRQLDT